MVFKGSLQYDIYIYIKVVMQLFVIVDISFKLYQQSTFKVDPFLFETILSL